MHGGTKYLGWLRHCSFISLVAFSHLDFKFKPETVLKSRSSTSKFWMYYNCSSVHVNFQDMFHTYEKRYASKCNFSALRFSTKFCCCIMASEAFTSGSTNSGQKNCFETKKPVFYHQILDVL